MPDWIQHYTAAIRATYGEPLPAPIAAYLDTFSPESAANHAERDRVWLELDEATRRRLLDLSAKANPQLHN